MRELTARERRTLRLAGIGICVYLLLFGGWQAWKHLGQRRTDYLRLVQDAARLRREIKVYEDRALAVKKLMEAFRLDPAKLSKVTLVAEATAAVQKSALSGGLQLGPVRETPARGASHELATVQLEGSGPVTAVLGFLGRFESLGYPLLVDSLQLTVEAARPGQVKLNLTLVVLDFEQWKPNAEKPNA